MNPFGNWNIEGSRKIILGALAVGFCGLNANEKAHLLIAGVYGLFVLGNMVEHWCARHKPLAMNITMPKDNNIYPLPAVDPPGLQLLHQKVDSSLQLQQSTLETVAQSLAKTMEGIGACQQALNFVVQSIQQRNVQG
jgi:hypothetical protein